MALDRREAIRDLRQAYGQHISDEPTMSVPVSEDRLAESLVTEEYQELLAALADGDLVETADAIADLQVVLEQMALLYGINTDLVFEEVHTSNLSKIHPDGTVHYDENGKVVKPEHFRRPDIASALQPSNIRARELQWPDIVIAPSVGRAGRVLPIHAPELANLTILSPMLMDGSPFVARKVFIMAGVQHDKDFDEILQLAKDAVAGHPQGEVLFLKF